MATKEMDSMCAGWLLDLGFAGGGTAAPATPASIVLIDWFGKLY